jgi:hypothetical protein
MSGISGEKFGIDTYARFLHDRPDYISMTQEEYTKAIEAVPLPMPGPPPQSILIQEAIQTSYYTSYAYQVGYLVRYHTRYCG